MRQTLGTGMMAPLSLANNFHGDYYAGPSGLAIGALSAGRSIGEALREIGDYKYEQRMRGEQQAERDRQRMEDLNQRQAVAQALNPMQAAQSSGMGNRDMTRRMVLPDAGTQMSLYNVAEAKRKEAASADYQKKAAFAQAWAARQGYRQDPTGEGFREKLGFNPFEFEGVADIIAKAEEKEAQRQWQEDMKREGWAQTAALKSMGGGGGEKEYKPELFVSPQGQAVWVKPGEQVPQGYMPHANNMGVTVNADGTTTINTGGNLKSIPNAAVASLTGNFSTLNRIDESLAAIEKAPFATNYLKGTINEFAPNMINRMDPDGAQARAALGDLGSTIIHDRSGAAVTASEYPRLRPFIPTAYDDAKTAKMKLERFKQIVAEETRLYADNFGPDMGYKRPESWNKYLNGQTAQQPAQTQTGGGAKVLKFDAQGNPVN